MQIAKWGNSLAVRLPKALVEKLGLKEGDQVEVTVERQEDIARQKRLAALKRIRKYRGWMPKDFKFDREEAHERGQRLDEPHERD
ncbi:MAG: AbrB/MazE/SpoVT family DNA-binding domain-containing protein [Rhizomicrobium sp.]